MTIISDNDEMTLGVVDGAANLTLNCPFETIITGTIGLSTPLTGLVTDAAGSLVFANTDGGVNDPNIMVNGIREFNDPITISETVNIRGNGGSVDFNNTIDGSRNFILSGINGATAITFNADVGATTPIGAFRVFNTSSVIRMKNTLFKNNGRQQWDANMIIDSPTQTLTLESSGTSNDPIRLPNNRYVRGVTAGTQSLVINAGDDVVLLGPVGDNNLPLLNFTIQADNGITSSTSEINLTGSMDFQSALTLTEDLTITADNINFQDTVDNGGFDLTLNDAGLGSPGEFNGDLTGSGDFNKIGNGTLLFNQATTLSGSVNIQAGTLYYNPAIDNPCPTSPTISLGSTASISDGAMGNLTLSQGQTLMGSGLCLCDLVTNSQATVSPGFSPGQLQTVSMDLVTDSTLVMELNGTTPGTEYDQILTDGLILTGNLDVSLGYEPNIGDAFTIIDVSNGLAAGTFSGMPEGTVFNIDGYHMSISYLGGDGNDVVLTVDREAIYYVDADATNTGTNNGESWPSAFLTIQDALVVAESDSAIWVAEGTYYPDEGGLAINDDTDSSFVLEHMVHLYGGFAGGETELTQRDPSSNLTILSGDIDNNDINTDGNDIAENVNDIQGSNAIHVVNGASVTSETIFDGFVVTAGHSEGNGADQVGAGMYCDSGSTGPSINDTVFIGNLAQNRGAASFGCTQNVTQTSYFYNHANDLAGAVYTTSGGYMDDVWLKVTLPRFKPVPCSQRACPWNCHAPHS